MSSRTIALKTLLLAAAAGASLAMAQPAEHPRLAIVIGNDAYRHVSQLTNAENDARLFGKTLRDAGFEIIGGVRANLNREAMGAAIDQLKYRIGQGTDVVFYFAGHGVQITTNPILLPTDIIAGSPEQVLRDGINLFDVQDELKDAHFALLVIDACRDNPFPPKAGGSRGIGTTRGLLAIEPAEGSAIILSASRGQTALDGVPGITAANGLFTYDLVHAIRQPGVDVLMALRQVRDQVEDEAKRVNHAQRPALVEEMRGQFILFPNQQGSSSQSPSPPPYRDCPGEMSSSTLDAVLNSGINAQVNLVLYPEGTSKHDAAGPALRKAVSCLRLLEGNGVSTSESRQFLRQIATSERSAR